VGDRGVDLRRPVVASGRKAVKVGNASVAYKELNGAVGEVLRANPNLPGWASAWKRLEKAHKTAQRSSMLSAPTCARCDGDGWHRCDENCVNAECDEIRCAGCKGTGQAPGRGSK
jgi:hypothetical protein